MIQRGEFQVIFDTADRRGGYPQLVLRKIIRVATRAPRRSHSGRGRVRRAAPGGRAEGYSSGGRCEVASSSAQSSSV